MRRIEISALTRVEIEKIVEEANFTEEQLRIFLALNKDSQYDYGIMLEIGMTGRRYYKIKKIVIQKVERIAQQFGYECAIKKR
jgi:hypothetical protein